MKAIRIILLAALALVVTASGTLASTVCLPSGGCISDGQTWSYCPECPVTTSTSSTATTTTTTTTPVTTAAPIATTTTSTVTSVVSTPAATPAPLSPSSQPVNSQFLKDNYQVPTSLGSGGSVNTGSASVTVGVGSPPYPGTDRSLFAALVEEAAYNKYLKELKEKRDEDDLEESEKDLGIGLTMHLQTGVGKSTLVDKYKAQGMTESQAIDQAIADVQAEAKKYEAEGMSEADAFAKAYPSLGYSTTIYDGPKEDPATK